MTATEIITDVTGIGRRDANVGKWERLLSGVGGGALLAYGLKRRSTAGIIMAVAGGRLISRAAFGYCPGYRAMGIDRAHQNERFERSITINKPPAEVYRYWRDFTNLPRFMKNLESVEVRDGRSHWVARTPGGFKIEWDAEITAERENELISWRSLPGSDIETSGSVRFKPAQGRRGTELQMNIRAEAAAAGVRSTFPIYIAGWQIDEDLRRFKRLMETGEIPTTKGQPVGASS
jgi:uncharacterized membrane protein